MAKAPEVKKRESDFDEDTETLRDYGTFFLFGEVEREICTEAAKYILAANIKRKHKSICLMINSSGGDVIEAFALISIIKSSAIPVIAIATGSCSSAALFIAMSCHSRIIDENCTILSHQYSAELGHSKHVDLMSQMTDLKCLATRIENLYVKETEKPLKYVKKYLVTDRDVFLSAEQAIEHGLFDGLLHNHTAALYHQDIDISK